MLTRSPHDSCGSWPIAANVSPINFTCLESRGAFYFLLSLKSFDNRRELGQNLLGLLVELDLSADQLSQIAQRLGGIKHLGMAIVSA